MSFVSDLFSGGGTGTAREASEMFTDIPLTDYDRQIKDLQQLVLDGKITPEQFQAAAQDPSMLAAYKVDPRLKTAQMNALEQLQGVAEGGGFTATDRARLENVARDEAVRERGAREAIMQSAQARGVGGSGLDMAQRLISGQASAGRRSAAGQDAAARAEARTLQAMQSAGQLGGKMREQQFGEKERMSRAQDMINRFNTQNLNQSRQWNASQRQRANEINTQRRFDVQGDINRLRQRPFSEQITRAQGASGGLRDAARMEEERRRSGAQIWGDMISGASASSMMGGGAGGGAMMAFSDENLKENIEPTPKTDIKAFVDSLDFKKYDYKDKEMGEGKQFGMIAQDLEKTEVGKSMVEDTPKGKAVNYAKSQAVTLGILKDLTERMEDVERA